MNRDIKDKAGNNTKDSTENIVSSIKELYSIILKFNLSELFINPTNNGLIKFFRYAFVGGIAFIVDYAVFVLVSLLVSDTTIGIILATTAGFIAGIIVNFILSKKFVFTEKPKIGTSTHASAVDTGIVDTSAVDTGIVSFEFIAYLVIGIIGYFLNIVLVLGLVKLMSKYIAKIIAAAIVLVYNFVARKKIIY